MPRTLEISIKLRDSGSSTLKLDKNKVYNFDGVPYLNKNTGAYLDIKIDIDTGQMRKKIKKEKIDVDENYVARRNDSKKKMIGLAAKPKKLKKKRQKKNSNYL